MIIPSQTQITILLDSYKVPPQKRQHMKLVAEVALFLADKLLATGAVQTIDKPLLRAAALLHDIDCALPPSADKRHPDASVQILRKEGFADVAAVVSTHGLHTILDPRAHPTTWEEKLLYLADKMVKYEVITVDKRFDLWRNEHLPQAVHQELEACYPKVKELEKEVFRLAHTDASEVAKCIN